jgi:hypothetical protein
MGRAPVPPTCYTGPSYIHCPPTPCFFHRVDSKPPVFRETVHMWNRAHKYRASAQQSRGSDSMAKLAAAIA